MATKTLSVDEEAYEILAKARKTPTESFSKVIKRATWENRPKTCGEAFAILQANPHFVSDETLDLLDAAQREDTPPIDKWSL